MLRVLRIALYIQLLLGIGRFAGWIVNERVWETHISLGFIIAILALVALRPRPEVPADGVRTAARFVPLVALLTGIAMLQGAMGGLGFVILHMILGVGTIGLVEMAAGRERRGTEPPGTQSA